MLYTANQEVQALRVSAEGVATARPHRRQRQHQRRAGHRLVGRRPLQVEHHQQLPYFHPLGSWWILM
jgi:hypothetical protein